jgi:hypothetical protein
MRRYVRCKGANLADSSVFGVSPTVDGAGGVYSYNIKSMNKEIGLKSVAQKYS